MNPRRVSRERPGFDRRTLLNLLNALLQELGKVLLLERLEQLHRAVQLKHAFLLRQQAGAGQEPNIRNGRVPSCTPKGSRLRFQNIIAANQNIARAIRRFRFEI